MEHFLSQGELFFKTWMSFLKREFFFKVECFFTRWFSSRGSRGARLPLSSPHGYAFVRRAGDKYRLIFAGKTLRRWNIVWYLLENSWGGKLVIMKKVVFLLFRFLTKRTKSFFSHFGTSTKWKMPVSTQSRPLSNGTLVVSALRHCEAR